MSLVLEVVPGISCATKQSEVTRAEREALLNEGFAIASMIPRHPLGPDRGRAQETVVIAAMDAGFLELAELQAHSIEGWRRGQALARIGQRHAAAGDLARARECVNDALGVAAKETEWKKERISVEAASTLAVLRDDAEADRVAAGATPAELGKLTVARTALVDPSALDALTAQFDRDIATLNFDLARNGIDGYIVLLERSRHDAVRATRSLAALDAAIPGLPMDLQVTTRIRLARLLARLDRRDEAAAQLAQAEQTLASTTFLPEDVIPLSASVARCRRDLGDAQGARKALDRLRDQFPALREGIVDLRRAASMRALAEGYCELGDLAAASACYTQALTEGDHNPNARPRAEDLSATCASMARVGYAPSPTQCTTIAEITLRLVDPW